MAGQAGCQGAEPAGHGARGIPCNPLAAETRGEVLQAPCSLHVLPVWWGELLGAGLFPLIPNSFPSCQCPTPL